MYTENLKNEIKGILDQDVEHREMLFRRGYLLTDRRQTDVDVYPFYGLWQEACVGQYYLYVHKDQTFYICTKGSVAAVMVGHAYNPFDMKHMETELCEDLITAYEKGLDAYFDKLCELQDCM